MSVQFLTYPINEFCFPSIRISCGCPCQVIRSIDAEYSYRMKQYVKVVEEALEIDRRRIKLRLSFGLKEEGSLPNLGPLLKVAMGFRLGLCFVPSSLSAKIALLSCSALSMVMEKLDPQGKYGSKIMLGNAEAHIHVLSPDGFTQMIWQREIHWMIKKIGYLEEQGYRITERIFLCMNEREREFLAAQLYQIVQLTVHFIHTLKMLHQPVPRKGQRVCFSR